MKTRILLFTACSVLLLPSLRAADEARSRHSQEDGDEKTTELGEHMEKMGRAFRALRREVADSTKNENSLKQVAIIRTNAEAAAKLKPEKTTDVPADQQTKFLADYSAHMKSFLTDVSALESALKTGNNAAAADLVNKMKRDMDESHKQFRKKKDRM